LTNVKDLFIEIQNWYIDETVSPGRVYFKAGWIKRGEKKYRSSSMKAVKKL